MPEFHLHRSTTLTEIVAWTCRSGDEIAIFVSRDASFELFAEGTFIAAIQALKATAARLHVKLAFDMERALKSPALDQEWPDSLNGLGGAALIHSADHIEDGAGRDITRSLQDASWVERIVNRHGVVGDGKRQSIICRHPGTPIPRCLREGTEVTIPTRLKFEKLLRRLGEGLGAAAVSPGANFLDSITEDELSGFLFEAFRNAIEHKPEICLPGIWGVIIEKLLIVREEEITSRSQIPAIIHAHLAESWQKVRRGRSMFVLCVSVCDYGPGIQHTLPPLEGRRETEWERLLRAFTRGVSRKPKSGSPDWGQGLPNILDTASAMKALLFVRSAGEAAIADGGAANPIWTRLSGSGLAAEHVPGTSLSVVWAVTGENPDQATFDF